ncbi:zinc finger C3H1 domain-containing protein isoform X2 [Dermochelys coriacea]|uniref:zinc finger C3H1 domain-containing protein isoform X2 n=1 Tax=Dermochelys coriacea TaxID=27794 RepID=UPI001CA822A4|nr:zinc finger C3H1 domain-containing protein isoform X2 [Dermochelys coriacea]
MTPSTMASLSSCGGVREGNSRENRAGGEGGDPEDRRGGELLGLGYSGIESACAAANRSLLLLSAWTGPMAAATAPAEAAPLEPSGLSPKEEGELEDGEISDDDNNGSELASGLISTRPYSRRRPPPSLRGGASLSSSSRRFPRSRHQPPPELGHLHSHGGYRPKESFRSHPPPLPSSRMPPGSHSHSDSGPRLSFWERSHNALDRFRFRGRPYRGGGRWGRSRGGGDRGSNPPGRPPGGGGGPGFSCGQGWRESSPRKSKTFGRSPSRKQNYSSKNENCVEESFEDLLLKYKQIQLELEYINKDEKLALNSREETVHQDDAKTANAEDQIAVENVSITKEAIKEVSPEEKNQVIAFQAFELKPLRQKLSTAAERNRLKKTKDGTKQLSQKSELSESSQAHGKQGDLQGVEDKEQTLVRKLSTSDATSEKLLDEEEEMSELHLRLLALQSASKKWQQKEQQVMKESKEKLTKTKIVQQKVKTSTKPHSTKKTSTAAKQALRKQQTKAWKKMQQQKEQERRQKEEEQRKQEEEEERRKREEEIRKIRDLSNQEEQYNRFMKLVGGKRRSRSKSSDTDLRWSLDKQSTDSGGGIYQYDNYDEVAMDTDSETNSPASSPVQPPFFDCPMGYFPPPTPPVSLPLPPQVTTMQPLSQLYVEDVSCVSLDPPPPLPPLPPEEPEQPPKPPFADEEEEEEMLLREELLKSLANKRAFKSEETSSNSGPPSPPVPNNSQPVPRSNLSAVSINTVSQPRVQNTKFVRVPRPPRAVITLPKHKSVVVTLNDSDDSESDGEPSNSTNSVFGGLESMIKEARRTAEASKPKAPPKSEKENDPMRTPDALPEDKKIEYRLLKEEIASREKQRLIKSDSLKNSSSPANSDGEVDGVGRIAIVTKQVTEAEAKLKKHKLLLMKDESVLKHLLQQEAKKRESVRIAENKIAKLAEQLQATEKILDVNRVFLKKLQEQIHKVQQRVTVKKALALKYGEELARAKAVASKEIGKRKLEQDHLGPSKMLKLDYSPASSPKKHSAELIALEKKRLQQLEYEYALKIQKLKEARALQTREQPNITPNTEEESEFVLPQPSLHDLTQDKLTLDSEENYFDDEILSNSNRERRRSFRESSSFTKPNLKHMDTPKQEINKLSKKAVEEPELFLGLNIDELKKLYAKADSLKELLIKSTAVMTSKKEFLCGQEILVDMDIVTAQSKQTEVKPFPFGPYHSPLLVFKSYRFSPYFRTKEKLYLSSVSYSNMIEPKQCFCRFDLTGTCNDDDCQWQHMKDCTVNRKQLFQDILSYNLALIGCSEKSTDEEISIATEKYVEKLFGVNRDRMSVDQMAVLLVSNINESKGHTPPFTTWKDKRKWRPKYWRKPVLDSSSSSSSSEEEQSLGPVKYAHSVEHKTNVRALDAVVTPDDVRYFTNETDDISNLEASVLENPCDVQLWIKLAYKYLSQNEGSSSECLDSALNVLARALENNKENPEIWCHYLKLFSKRGTKEEVQEMCETAVEYAPTYQIWWTFLNLENSFDGKDYVCGRMLQFLMESTEGEENSDLLSFQLLETLLYRVHLSMFTGRHQNALALLQNALKSANEKIIAERLTISDRCLAWLAYIHLIEFSVLPVKFYDPANANPSRIMNKEPFLIPWQTVQDVKTNPDMLLAVFEDAVQTCTDENLGADERIAICLPLYRNMIALQQLLERWEAAIELCISLLELCPVNCQLLEALVTLYLRMEQHDKAYAVWLTAFEKNPQNAQVFYHMCKFLISQKRADSISPLLQEFVAAFFENVCQEHGPMDLLRYLLNFPMPIEFTSPLYKGYLTDDILNQQVPFLWQIYCLCQSLHASVGEALDAYEAALGAVMQQETVQNIWMDYLVFLNSKVVGSNNKVQEFKLFTDLVNRCLITVPTRYPIPFSTADYWTNYEFHNRVIFFYLSCVPKSQHSKTLERFCSSLPTNPGLALRLLQQLWEENNIQILKLQAKMFTYNIPTCLATWKIAIAAECFLKGQREVHHLYQRAFQKLPLCATLWKDQLLFEASGGGKTDNLRKLVSKCQEVGVSLDELLNLNTYRTESKNH